MSSPASSPVEPLLLSFGPFELDEANARLVRDGQPLPVAPRPFEVLCCLARRPGQLVTKDALLDAVWGHRFVSESVLKTTISDLRTLLGDDARQPRYIETAARRGYRFIGRTAPPPLPMVAAPAQRQASEDGFVGRDQELDAMRSAWSRAQSGQRQLVWLSGEAGIGKSTLAVQFMGEAGAALQARGQCVEQSGAGEPYLPVLEALAELCRADAELAGLLREVAPTWFLQLPWLGSAQERDELRRSVAGAGQDRMLREMGEWLDRVCARRPLLLLTEDLHWSDQATVRLIDHVARRRTPARLMWIATFRHAELAAGEPMPAVRHELRLHRLATELALDPFSPAQVADFAQRHGAVLAGPLVDELHRRTDGLPLFVASVLDDFAAHGAAAPDAVPESLAAVIERRIDALPEADAEMLEAASVVGVEFSCVVVARLLDLPPEPLLARMEALARRQQWIAAVSLSRAADGSMDGRCRFSHALVRQVLYQRIGALRRAQWHLAAARAMTRHREAGGDVAAAELALHFERGHDLPAAMRHYVEAADAALARYAHAQAMQLATQGLGLLAQDAAGAERDEREMSLLAAWTVAASQVQGVTASATHAAYQRIEALDARLPVRPSRGLEVGLGWVEFVRGNYEVAMARAQQAQQWGRERDDPLLLVTACHLGGAVRTFQGRLDEARRALEEGIEIGLALPDRMELARSVVDLGTSMHARLAHVHAHQGQVGQARAQISLAEARAAANGQPYARRLVLVFASFLELRLERPRAVQALAETLQQLATEHAIRQAEGPARWLRGWALAQLGDPVAGHELIREGYALDSQIEMRRGRSGVLGFAAEASRLAGRSEAAQRELDEAFALAAQMGERLFLPDLWLTRARLARALGEPGAAREAARAGIEEARAQGAAWPELAAQADWCEHEGQRGGELAALRSLRGRIDCDQADSPLLARVEALLLQHGADPG